MKSLGLLNHEIETDAQGSDKNNQACVKNPKSKKNKCKNSEKSSHPIGSNQPAKNYLCARSFSKKQQNLLGMVWQYQREIIQYILSKEKQYFSSPIDPQFIKKSTTINSKSRAFLVKYFFKMKSKYKFKRSTIFLATYYMDYYFSTHMNLNESELVLFAQAALFIAMKYEEIYPPLLYQWTNKGKQIISAQSKILYALNFQLIYSSIEDFINILAYQHDIQSQKLASIRFLSDICLFDVTSYRMSASDLAQAIVNAVLFPNRNDKMELNIKWMLERNQNIIGWLQHTEEYRNEKLTF